MIFTDEVDDEAAVGGPAVGPAKVGLPVRRVGEGPPGGDREDGRVAGVGERVAEAEDAAVARVAVAGAAGVRLSGDGDEEKGHWKEETRKWRHWELQEPAVCNGAPLPRGRAAEHVDFLVF